MLKKVLVRMPRSSPLTLKPVTLPTLIKISVLLFLSLLITRWPLFEHFTTHYIGGSQADAGLYIWLIKENLHRISEWLSNELLFQKEFSSLSAFYPYAKSLAWSDSYLLPTLLVGLLTKLHIPFVIAYNLIAIAAMVLNGATTFYLLASLTGKKTISTLCALAFMLSSVMAANIGHPQLQHFYWIPLLIIELLFLLQAKDNRKAIWAFLLALTVSAAFYTTVYYALLGSLSVALLAILLVFARPKVFFKPKVKQITSFLLGLTPLLLILPIYLDVKESFGPRKLFEAYYFSAHALSYMSAQTLSLFYSWSTKWTHSEGHLFIGMTTLIGLGASMLRLTPTKQLKRNAALLTATFLIGSIFTVVVNQPVMISLSKNGRYISTILCPVLLWVSLIFSIRHIYLLRVAELKLQADHFTRRTLSFLTLVVALIFILISFGPLGNPAKGEPTLGLFTLLYELLPGFDGMRAVSRAGIVALFFAITSVGIALSRFQLSKKGVALIATVIALEGLQSRYPTEPLIAPSSAIEHLKATALNTDAVISLPLGSVDQRGVIKDPAEFAKLNVTYMNWLVDTRLHFVNGYSGIQTKITKEFPRKFSNFPDQRSINTLGLIPNLTYILYTPHLDTTFNKQHFITELDRFKNDLKLIMIDDAGTYLFKLTASYPIHKTILLPPYGSNTTRALSTDFKLEKGKHFKLKISLNNSETKQVISSVDIEYSKDWQTFSFPLPQPSSKVLPTRAYFEVLNQRGEPIKEQVNLLVRDFRFHTKSKETENGWFN